ncbi:MAG: Hsp20/alpha crystallin family protein [Rubritepida sp.]|jgi:HSP20 family protein|nr:Hsp20/alpha crystallin family protein [Rubritepida sp.]
MDLRSLIPTGDSFAALRRDMERVFDQFGRGFALPATATTTAGFLSPKVDVAETAKGLEITAELPGVKPEHVSLDLEEGVLTLKAERREEKEEKDEARHFHLVERASGTYLRRFALPFLPASDAVEARFEQGVLHVFVPRPAEAAKPVSRIAIRTD